MIPRGHHGLLLGAGAPVSGFPVYLSNTPTDLGGSDSTNHLVQMPATVNSGDLLIVPMAVDSNFTITTPSGWSVLITQSVSQVTGAVFYKVANGTEGGTTVNFVTFASERMEAQVIRIQAGTYQGVPVAAQANNVSGTANPDPPNLTPPWGSANTLWLAFAMTDDTRTVSVYPLPNNQYRTANAGSGSAFVTLASCSNDVAASSLDPGTFTLGFSSPWVAITVAVRPI